LEPNIYRTFARYRQAGQMVEVRVSGRCGHDCCSSGPSLVRCASPAAAEPPLRSAGTLARKRRRVHIRRAVDLISAERSGTRGWSTKQEAGLPKERSTETIGAECPRGAVELRWSRGSAAWRSRVGQFEDGRAVGPRAEKEGPSQIRVGGRIIVEGIARVYSKREAGRGQCHVLVPH